MIGVHPINKREMTRNGKRAAVRVSSISMPRVTIPLVTERAHEVIRLWPEGPPSKQSIDQPVVRNNHQ
jgi:hypothetical protein